MPAPARRCADSPPPRAPRRRRLCQLVAGLAHQGVWGGALGVAGGCPPPGLHPAPTPTPPHIHSLTPPLPHLTHPPTHPPTRQVRVITERAYHALFMSNMLIRPTAAELDDFGEPEFTIFNAGGSGGESGGGGLLGG
jgi:hypothetical protein